MTMILVRPDRLLRLARYAARVAAPAARVAALAMTVVIWSVLGFEVAVRCGSISPAELDAFPGSLEITDREGHVLREVVGDRGMRARWQAFDDLSPLVVAATLAVEDARFHDHNGIDGVGVLRAMVDNVRAGRVVSGASTVTMQLARLLSPSPKTLLGKLGEMVRARRLELLLDKEVILEQYLNRAPYGAGTIGVEAASQRYFGKPSEHLSLAEAAVLAGLPKAPSRLDPLRFPGRAKARQRHVLHRMLVTGAISGEAHDRAVAEPLVYRERPAPLAAMHFTDMVVAHWRSARQRADDSGRTGYTSRVRTTLDRHLQDDVERAVRDHVRALSLSGLSNAAVVVLDNRACAIRAMVGSADYWADEHGAVNGALARRQPGSTLKPFTYALAFERGDTPATVVPDIATRYGRSDGTVFRPKNFSGDFSGPVLMGPALGRSLNVPAIRVANRVGVGDLLGRLRALGFDSLDREEGHYGLGLTLGNGEVTLLELAQGYAALARGGLACRARALVDAGAPDLESSGPDLELAPDRVFSEPVSFLISDILSDESLRIEAFGPANALLLDFPVAVKTGTSTNWRDSWAIGYTEDHTVAVWSGNFDGRSMDHLAGATGAGPLFHRVMTATVERDRAQPRAPRPPDGVIGVEVCALSGELPSPDCPHTRRVHVAAEHRPEGVCDWHRSVTIDVRNGLRAGQHCPGEFTAMMPAVVLPPEYAGWQATSRLEPPPLVYSPQCPASGAIPGSVIITRPREGEVYLIEPGHDRATQTLRLEAQAEALAGAVTWSIDGRAVRRARWPYAANWPLEPGIHRVAVNAPGQRGHEVTIEVR